MYVSAYVFYQCSIKCYTFPILKSYLSQTHIHPPVIFFVKCKMLHLLHPDLIAILCMLILLLNITPDYY